MTTSSLPPAPATPDLADLVLFLGAGISLGEPTRGPLFRAVRDASAKRAGVDPRRWTVEDPRQVLLAHVIPEVFLKLLIDAGYELEAPLAAAVSGGPGAAPNAVHQAAAVVLAAGGTVWTTNWDCWIEIADPAARIGRAVFPTTAPPTVPGGYGKLHGSTDVAGSLRFTSPHILAPLGTEWADAVRDSCQDRTLVIAGYAGADIDLYPALIEAMAVARRTIWFEGAGDADLDANEVAGYERWRFSLDDAWPWQGVLPDTGRHLAWCGAGSPTTSPSTALLELIGQPVTGGKIPSTEEQFDMVDGWVRGATQTAPNRGRRLLVRALVHERLGQRWRAALRHVGVAVIGSRRDRRKAVRSLGNLVLLRHHPARRLLDRIFLAVRPGSERTAFIALHAGQLPHDPVAAADAAAGTTTPDIDTALNLAGVTRWAGDLRHAEAIARRQLAFAMAQDLASGERDWPERVSRSAFELAVALTWQGRLFEADDVCRSGLMRVSGAKWTAWEFTIRSVVRTAYGDHDEALRLAGAAVDILMAEGFDDFTPPIRIGMAASLRFLGKLDEARALLDGAIAMDRGMGQGTAASVLAEEAEQALACGDPSRAEAHLLALTGSKLPLWASIAHLRLAELGRDQADHVDAALAGFEAVGCQWGGIRARALRDGTDDVALAAEVATLGPTAVYRPDGPWAF